ncbi:hypothetical protein Acsp04_04970 [Actinomadura sp. NBRC 104425]|uniref:hypothetical protein n=1 Tax=Actinomadura sp. NBRC 104425 TaxID=3032204 RepID=UPI0024A03AD1|nr:hypothetical protein [Actinomadura sp. NBRC 104425]GLZ10262.1 hypothetical protein Acsp04_04970 [Actinomadura sp. NBRC 104425]
MADQENSTQTGADREDAPLGENGIKALQREREARKAAEKELAEVRAKMAEMQAAALRREVAAAKGLTEAQARFLTGETREELEAAADALTEAFRPAPSGPPKRRPTEALRGGADPYGTNAPSAADIADQIMRR